MIFKKVLLGWVEILHKYKKSEMTSSNDLTSPATPDFNIPSSFQVTYCENNCPEFELINKWEKKLTADTELLSCLWRLSGVNTDCVSWCSKNLKRKTIASSIKFVKMSIITILRQGICSSGFQAIFLSCVCLLDKWFSLHSDPGYGILE